MKILIVNKSIIPVSLYGGTERVIWYLGKELAGLGHEVSYLVKKGFSCPFGKVYEIDDLKKIIDQIPESVDLVHFNFVPKNLEQLKKPYLITMHGNTNSTKALDINTVFVSKNHAERFNSKSYVYNGLDWNDYMKPEFNRKDNYFYFLGNAAWRVKNVKGAVSVIKKARNTSLKVLGGKRLNFKIGFRFTLSRKIQFYGMVGGSEKFRLLNNSQGLIFPVRWHEPFGLAITESLFYGCPVFGTPYGSLPELVIPEVGFLSHKSNQLAQAINNSGKFSAKACHSYALEKFNSKQMALAYLKKYEKILNGDILNSVKPKLKEVREEKFLNWQ